MTADASQSESRTLKINSGKLFMNLEISWPGIAQSGLGDVSQSIRVRRKNVHAHTHTHIQTHELKPDSPMPLRLLQHKCFGISGCTDTHFIPNRRREAVTPEVSNTECG